MKKRKMSIWTIVYLILILLAMAVFVLPISLAVLTSFKSKPDLAKSVIGLPETLYLKNYSEAMIRSDFVHSLRNTALVVLPSVVLIVLCASMSGYAVARYAKEKRVFRALDKLYLASLMIPFQILMIPVYKIYKTLHMLNFLPGMILMLVDGCSEMKSFWLITFPLLKPISATVASLHVMWLWNDFNISVILLQKEAVRTITIKQFYFFGQYTADYGMAFAAAILSMIPVVLCFMFMQKYIVNGITVGAVKS